MALIEETKPKGAWAKFRKRFDLYLFVAFVLMMVWIAVPSSFILNQVSMTITRDDQGVWYMTSIYSVIEGNLSRYEIRPWAVPCLDAGPPTAVTFYRQVMLFGLIPMRPSRYSFIINPENAPVIPTEN